MIDQQPNPLPATPFPEINRLLGALLEGVQSVLGPHLVALYLEGSLAAGDFDLESDIDFAAITDEDISEEQFIQLQALHDRLAALDTPWAIQLEGFYISKQAIRMYQDPRPRVPDIERGRGERLKWVVFDLGWEIHRYQLRERGIVLFGPPPQTLIELVTPQQLRRSMKHILAEWVARIPSNPAELSNRGYYTYVVLSLCRILYTLQTGAVASKRVAAEWARGQLDERWGRLIKRVWQRRLNPEQPASAEDIHETLAFVDDVLNRYSQDGGNDGI